MQFGHLPKDTRQFSYSPPKKQKSVPNAKIQSPITEKSEEEDICVERIKAFETKYFRCCILQYNSYKF